MPGQLIRFIVFVVSVLSVLGAATQGTPLPAVAVLLLLVAVATTVYVRAQYVESLTSANGSHYLLPWKWSVGMVAGGIAGLVVFAKTSADGLGLFSAIVGYLGLGFLVMWGRAAQSNAPPLPSVLGALGGLGASWLGFALLGHGPGWVAPVLIGVGGFLVVPVSLQLLSSRLILPLAVDSGPLRGRVFAAGAGVCVAATVLGVVLSRSFWLLIPLVVLIGLAIALASATQADIAAVVVVLALFGVTPYQASLPSKLNPGGRDAVLVALGDSYMSGEGASVYFEHTDDGGGNQCRRSPTAWAAMAGQQDPFDGLEFLACSGARTFNVRAEGDDPPPKAQTGRLTQLAQYEADQASNPFTPKLVVVSLGGNDAGFSTIGEMCLAPGDCADKRGLWDDALKRVYVELGRTYDEIDKTFHGVPVVVIPYPDPIARGECSQITLTEDERNFISDFLGRLDGMILLQAKLHGFHYLADMRNALSFDHLQLCDPGNHGRPGINFIGLRSVRGIPEQRFNPAHWIHNSLHPNERGHAAELQVFEHWLAENQDLPSRLPAPDAATQAADERALARAEDAPPHPPCLLFTQTKSDCTSRGQTWAAQQVGHLMAVKGGVPLGALVLLGAWSASIAAFAWRRRKALGL